MIETCKEDPVIFIETILGHELFTYQKVYVREVFKDLKKQDEPDFLTKHLNMPVETLGTIDCPVCGCVFAYQDVHIHLAYKYVDCPKCRAAIILEGSRFSWMEED